MILLSFIFVLVSYLSSLHHCHIILSNYLRSGPNLYVLASFGQDLLLFVKDLNDLAVRMISFMVLIHFIFCQFCRKKVIPTHRQLRNYVCHLIELMG